MKTLITALLIVFVLGSAAEARGYGGHHGGGGHHGYSHGRR